MSRDLPVLVGIELPSGCHLCPFPETLAFRAGGGFILAFVFLVSLEVPAS